MSLKEELVQLIFKYGLDTIKTTLDEAHVAVIERAMLFIPKVEPEPEPESEPESEHSINEIVVPQETNPPLKGKNDKKKAQREAERLKREANAAEGIFPEQLLTEENLSKWYSAKYSNAYIAREFVGCREEDVAKAMKKFNIKKLNK